MSSYLLLFDIDGTLISSGGAGRRAMLAAAETVLKQSLQSDFVKFAGMTDRLIIRHLLQGNNIAHNNEEQLVELLLSEYVRLLELELIQNSSIAALQGVVPMLDRLINPHFYCGLVTGNIQAGAQLKLGASKILHRFTFGAFGDDAEDRNLLPPIALKRAESATGQLFARENVWIIGDTPRDIECGRVNGFRTMAVATGGAGYDELRSHNPDVLFRDFSDTEAVVRAFRV